jgi:hypothetical protein
MKALRTLRCVLRPQPGQYVPESWLCVDCGVNTAPGCPNRKEVELAFALRGETESVFTAETEVYTVTRKVWQATGLAERGGCLCIGCLEQRIGRRLKPNDFVQDPLLNGSWIPATRRLRQRRPR